MELIEAVKKRQVMIVKNILADMKKNNQHLNTQDETGRTALITAVLRDLANICSMLIADGADVHLADKDGDTALSRAAAHGYCAIISQLMRAGADIDHQNQTGYTPLMLAVNEGEDRAVTLLLEEGADVLLQNRTHQTAFDTAKKDSIRTILNNFQLKKDKEKEADKNMNDNVKALSDERQQADAQNEKKEAKRDAACSLEALTREANNALNQISPQTVKKTTAALGEIEVRNITMLHELVRLIFEKAITDPSFAKMYADMCCTLEATNTYDFVSVVLNEDRNQFFWIQGMQYTSLLAGPYSSSDVCTNAILGNIPPPLHSVTHQVTLDKIVLRDGKIVSVFKSVDRDEYYMSFLPMNEMDKTMMCLSYYPSEGAALKAGRKVCSFEKKLVGMCQDEYQMSISKGGIYAEPATRRADLMCRKSSMDMNEFESVVTEVDDFESSVKKRKMGNIRFICELCNLKMIRINTINRCIQGLLMVEDGQIEEDNIEVVCEMLTSVGQKLDEEEKSCNNSENAIDTYLTKLADLRNSRIYSSRLRFRIDEVTELRRNRWSTVQDGASLLSNTSTSTLSSTPPANGNGVGGSIEGRGGWWRQHFGGAISTAQGGGKVEDEKSKEQSQDIVSDTNEDGVDVDTEDIPINSLYAWLKRDVLFDKLHQLQDVCNRFNEIADCDTLEDLLKGHEDFNKKFLREEMKLSIVITNRILEGIENARKAKEKLVQKVDSHQQHPLLPPPPTSATTKILNNEGGGIDRMMSARKIPQCEVEMLRWLGKGGFGNVFLAKYDHQRVAVKCFGNSAMTAKNIDSICNEVNIMTQLKHPCLVELLGLVYDDRVGSDEPPKLVMEFAPNGSLYSLLHSKREISWADRHRMVGELASGLTYLHKKKVVHRDIKSMNVVLGAHMNAKWCDFGLSCLKKHSVESQTATVKGTGGSKEDSEVSVMGTFRWMSPELVNRFSGRCFESDIWAFGMLIYEMASRDIPFSDEPNEKVVQLWIMDGRGENVPEDCSSVLGDIMGDCWKERALRPTAEQIEHVMKEVTQSISSSSYSSNTLSGVGGSTISESGIMMTNTGIGSLSAPFSSMMDGNN